MKNWTNLTIEDEDFWIRRDEELAEIESTKPERTEDRILRDIANLDHGAIRRGVPMYVEMHDDLRAELAALRAAGEV